MNLENTRYRKDCTIDYSHLSHKLALFPFKSQLENELIMSERFFDNLDSDHENLRLNRTSWNCLYEFIFRLEHDRISTTEI